VQDPLACHFDLICFDEEAGVSFDQKEGGRRQHPQGLHGLRRVQPQHGEHPS
jgi:hypothetical protein